MRLYDSSICRQKKIIIFICLNYLLQRIIEPCSSNVKGKMKSTLFVREEISDLDALHHQKCSRVLPCKPLLI